MRVLVWDKVTRLLPPISGQWSFEPQYSVDMRI